jgi:hypothetical protein
MTNEDLLARIDALVAQEHRLRSQGRSLTEEEQRELQSAEEHLDQLWDLLRRRRASRLAGTDPDDAQERSISQVEHYLQ